MNDVRFGNFRRGRPGERGHGGERHGIYQYTITGDIEPSSAGYCGSGTIDSSAQSRSLDSTAR